MHFDATLNVLRSGLPHLITDRLDSNPQPNAPRLDFSSLQHLSVEPALFFISYKTSEKLLPCFSEEPPSGFGYPLGGVSRSQPWKFLNLQRSWDSLFRALFLFHDRRKFPVLLSTPALFSETFRLRTGASVVFSHRRSCAPVGYLKIFRGGVDCSLEFSDLSGFLPTRPIRKTFPFSDSPPVLVS